MTKKLNTVKKAAKATPITITVNVDKKNVKILKATSVCNMWKLNKEAFAEFPAATLFIRKDGEEFMKLHLVTKSNGKTWMKNDIEASRRKAPKKTEEETEETAENIIPITEETEETEETADKVFTEMN